MGVVLGFGAAGVMAAIGEFNWAMLVHGEQAIELHRPIPTEGRVSSVGEITGIWDKGKGAVVETTTVATDVATGEPMFTSRSASFIRGEGGWGGDRGPVRPAQRRARPCARSRGHLRDPPGPGAHLPPVGRPQPAALRPGVRGHGRLPEADPPRALHLRLHRPRSAAQPVRRRSDPVHARWRAASRPRSSPARRSPSRRGTPATARPSSRPPATTAASSSTAAGSPTRLTLRGPATPSEIRGSRTDGASAAHRSGA